MSVTLTLEDIADLRAYERERDAFLARVIAIKKKRRIPVGSLMTLVFENRDTIRFQIQEMARVERIATDEGIANQLRAFNPLISRPGRLSATLFIELTSDDQLRHWLPRLAGVEQTLELHIGRGADLETLPVVRAPGAVQHQPATISTVHYLRWHVTPDQTAKLEIGPATVVCTHPAYREEQILSDTSRQSIVADLR